MGSFQRGLFIAAIVALAPSCRQDRAPSKTPLTPPLAPTVLTATPVTSARLDLSWTPGSTNEVEFRISRSNAPGGVFVQVGTAPAGASAFTDLGIDPLTTYYYRVTAWNSKGESPAAGPVGGTTSALAWDGPYTGGPPLGLTQHSGIYDGFGKRMIVFGGLDNYLNFYNDVLQFDLSQSTPGPWAPVTTTGTVPPLFDHSAIYDALHKRMVVFGGEALYTPPTGDILVYQNKVYILDLDPASPTYLAWSQPAILGLPPAPRSRHTAVYDSGNQQMVIFGGYDDVYELADAHVLSLPASGPFTWSAAPSGPVKRQLHASIYDPARSEMLSYGGQDSNLVDGSLLNQETWSLSLQGPSMWTDLSGAVGTPGFRSGHAAIYDEIDQRMLLHGGSPTTSSVTGELWALQRHTIRPWVLLSPAGAAPAPRRSHTLLYDPVHRRMVVFGGMDEWSNAFDDVWILPF